MGNMFVCITSGKELRYSDTPILKLHIAPGSALDLLMECEITGLELERLINWFFIPTLPESWIFFSAPHNKENDELHGRSARRTDGALLAASWETLLPEMDITLVTSFLASFVVAMATAKRGNLMGSSSALSVSYTFHTSTNVWVMQRAGHTHTLAFWPSGHQPTHPKGESSYIEPPLPPSFLLTQVSKLPL